MIHFLAFVRTLVSAFHSTKVSTLGESVGTLSGWSDEPYVHHSCLVGIKPFVFWWFFLVWYLCAHGFITSCFACKALPFLQTTCLCWETQTEPCISMNHFGSALLLTRECYSLLNLRYYKLDKVHSFITSLIHLEPGLCQTKPLGVSFNLRPT